MSADAFTGQDGLDWLGITMEDYLKSEDILRGRHGNPLMFALMDARAAQGTDTTPADVLARYGIDPADPLKAARTYDKHRSQFD